MAEDEDVGYGSCVVAVRNRFLREGLASTLRKHGFRVVACVEAGQAPSVARNIRSAVVDDLDCLAVIRTWPKWDNTSRIVVLTGDRVRIPQMINYNFGTSLLDVVRALQGDRGVNPAVDDGNLAPLTVRQQQVLNALEGGLTTKEIAEFLRISAHTVEAHKRRIFARWDVQSGAQAVARNRAAQRSIDG